MKDDQTKRAKLAEEKGAALCLEEIKEDSLDEAIEYMCSQKEKIKTNIQRIQEENRAKEAASYILFEINKEDKY